MKYILVVLAFAFVILSCSDDDPNPVTPSELRGDWVQTETRTDTLSFDSLDNLETLNLKRGKETKNGNVVPKYRSGPHRYHLAEQKIALNWVLSSNSDFNEYYFEVMGNSLNIGNFYSSASGEILTFEKLD